MASQHNGLEGIDPVIAPGGGRYVIRRHVIVE
jgi:hypothetical protein